MPGVSTNDSEYFSAGAGGILGTNDLQQTVDKFNSAVDKLASVVGNMSKTGGRGSGATSSTPAIASKAKGAQFTTGFFPKMVSPSQISGMNQGMAGMSGSRMTFGRIASMNNSMQGGGASNGGGGNSSPPSPMGGGNANGGGSGTLGAVFGGLQAVGSAVAAYGASQLPQQVAMNAYATNAMLGVTPGMGNQYGRLYNQAFGTYNHNINTIANSPYDAAQGQMILNQVSGSPFSSGPLGSAAAGSTNAFGYINPSLGYAGAAQMASQLYSPQTSLAMRMMGYQTPRPAQGSNGQFQGGGQVMQSILQRWYGKGTVNQNTLNASLANGAKGYLNLQSMGLDPTQYGPQLQAYNKLFQQGFSPTAATNLFNGAAKNQGQAQSQLAKALYGSSNPSDLQKLKNLQAQQTGRTSGEAPGFNQGLNDAASLLTRFNEAMNKLLDGPLGKLAGIASGAGSVKSVGGNGGAGILKTGIGAAMSVLGFGALGETAGGLVHGLTSMFGGASGIATGGSTLTTQQNKGKPAGTSSMSSVNSKAANAVKDAEAQVGLPYIWGGEQPGVGFDCSGLVQWSYEQAGVNLPRTSQAQWSALSNKSVPLNKVQEGDLVFTAGSDGTATSPGHVAMMVSNNQIVEAQQTGVPIHLRSYNQSEWQHAARPVGGASVNPSTSNTVNNNTSPTTSGKGNAGAGGLGLSVGSYGSSNEVTNVASALLGGISAGTGFAGGTLSGGTNGAGHSGNANGASTKNVGNINSPSGFASAVLSALGAPNSAANVASLVHWEAMEGGNWHNTAKFNPLNTTMPEPGSTQTGSQGNIGSYTSWSQGVKATVSTLELPAYTSLVNALKQGNGLGNGSYAALGTWSGGAYTSVATGGANLPPGTTLVGERGPELVSLNGGENITSAKKTREMIKGQAAKAAQSPWITSGVASLMLANQPQNDHSQHKAAVSLVFPKGAICITTGSSSTTDVSNAVEQGMKQAVKHIENSRTIRSIAMGVKQGG